VTLDHSFFISMVLLLVVVGSFLAGLFVAEVVAIIRKSPHRPSQYLRRVGLHFYNFGFQAIDIDPKWLFLPIAILTGVMTMVSLMKAKPSGAEEEEAAENEDPLEQPLQRGRRRVNVGA
jgi:hypothetical protein